MVTELTDKGTKLIEDVANIPDEIANQLPHWKQVLRDLCREALGAPK